MKNYKKLVTIGLVAFFVLSIVYMFDGRLRVRGEYQEYLTQARDLAKAGVPTDAEVAYRQALNLHADKELYEEIGAFYLENDMTYPAQKLYRDILQEKYPKDQQTYCFGEKIYLNADNIKGAFRVYYQGLDQCKNYDEAKAVLEPYWYDYKLSSRFDDAKMFSGSTPLAAVQSKEGWYYINRDTMAVSAELYRQAGEYSSLAAVITDKGAAVCVDEQGNVKITSDSIAHQDPDFGKVEQFVRPSDHLLAAYNGKVWNFYDAEKLTKVSGGYYDIRPYSLGIAAVTKNGNDWALIDTAGKELTGYEFNEVLTDDKNCLCRTSALVVKRKDGYWLVDQTGKNINQKPFEDALAFAGDTMTAVKTGGKWKFINAAGEIKDLGDFDRVRSFANGLAAVCKESKWGYIDEAGNIVIDCQFEDAQDFSKEGLTFVKEDLNSWRLLKLTRLNCD